jgi:hypothetical protein
LYYYLRSVFIAVKPGPSDLSVLEVTLPLFLVLAIVLPALLGVCLLQDSASLGGSTRRHLAVFVSLQLFHDLLGLV